MPLTEGKGKVITLLETSFTFPEAKATAVSAITSAFIDPKPPVALVLMKLSSTTSSRSVIYESREIACFQLHYQLFLI